MKGPDIHTGDRPRLSPLCLALAVFAGTGSAFGTWLVLLPRAQEQPGVTVSAPRTALGTCLSARLREAPEFTDTHRSRAQAPLVSVLAHPDSDSSRVVFEGSTRLSFVVTLTDAPGGETETRLASMPVFDPAAAVARAVTACSAPDGK